ncbi:MAG: HAMP domain-containing protein [Lachnospira sp.]|nr:HAMP domain-containing protein [Lachnospira sp.]
MKKLLNSMAVRIVIVIQLCTFISSFIMVLALMPVIKEHVTEEFLGEVNVQVVFVLVVGLVLAMVLGTVMSLVIIKPIKMLNNGIANLSTLDFRASGNEQKLAARRDEIGTMACSIFKMRESLMKIVEDLKKQSDFLNESANNLSLNTNETNNAITQVERAVEEIAQGANSQAEETQLATENVILIGDMVENTVGQVNLLSSNSNAMQKASDEAFETLKQLDSTNDKTKSAIDRIYTQTNVTNESALKIKQAITMISEIAEETNLLSLNASIEAARAGEQGRGFAVVAAQIQKLAEQSNESAKQIEEISDSLIKDSEDAVQTMQAVRLIINEQSANVEKTGIGFDEVKKGIDSSIASVNMISSSMDKLDDARTKVVDVVSNLTAIAQENAASSQETLASVSEVTATVGNVASQGKELKDVADKLRNSINVFKF